jgi:hypothetical protein
MMKAALGSPVITNTRTKISQDFVASRPTTYICVVLIVALVSYAYWLRTSTIFSCQADGYSNDRYLAYCSGTNYADYEHGAFRFALEPSVQNFASNADVLFLGNSRLQAAFSTVVTTDWFSAVSARYYLMGFAYYENMVFTEELLRRIHPRARVYIINLDDFFDLSESPPVKTILHDPEAQHRYEVKRRWQHIHEPICKTFPVLCGVKFAIFRSRETGAYYPEGVQENVTPLQKATPVSYDQVVSQNVVDNNTHLAIDFLSQFTQGKCVILTMVPFVQTKSGNANAIANGLGMKLVTPEILEGLQTYDGYHLSQSSAERWSHAFFEAAGSKIRSCLTEQGAAH